MTDDLIVAVERACNEISLSGGTVTFAEVAGRVGMSRTTLYRRAELRAVVEEHRIQARDAYTLTGLATQIENLSRSLDAVAAKVRRHEEELRRLNRRPFGG